MWKSNTLEKILQFAKDNLRVKIVTVFLWFRAMNMFGEDLFGREKSGNFSLTSQLLLLTVILSKLLYTANIMQVFVVLDRKKVKIIF